ncbi:MAG: TonB family protein [Deltaproteobacteria bacterium]|nr:TonB family protein [Deltaproteobacteria bacterium]
MTDHKKKRASPKLIWIASGGIAVLLIVVGVVVVKMLISDDAAKRRQMIQMVTLIKPPPPPPPPEKPPEPEIKKQEVIEEKPDKPEPEESKDSQDDKPAGDQLGLDADGTAGSDGFGLVGKKGGRALIGGDMGSQSLLRRYAWYTQILQDEIRQKVKKRLDEAGGIPKGKFQTLVRIVLDEQGSILSFDIVGSSGNHKMDDAVKETLASARVQEPPPEGMPKAMKLRISSQG